MHRLGTVEDVRKAHPRITAFVSLLPGAAVLRVEGRTQRALRPLTETEVIEATALAQRLRETKQLAKTKTARQARKILDDIRVTTEATAGSTAWGTLVQPGTGQPGVGTGTGTANLVSASHTPPAPGTPNTSGTPVPDSVPVPEAVPASEYHMPGTDSAGTGTTAGTGKQVPETGTTHLVPTPGTGSQAGTAPGTEVPVQVVSLIKSSLPSPGTSAGSAPVEPGTAPLPKPQGAARQPGTSMTEQEKDEVVHALRRYLTDDGANFDLDKLNAGYSERITTQRDAVRRHFGIGTRNANALMRRAREDGPLRDHEPSVETEPDAQQEHDAGGLLDFDRAFALNAPAIGELVLAGPAAHTEP